MDLNAILPAPEPLVQEQSQPVGGSVSTVNTEVEGSWSKALPHSSDENPVRGE